MIVIMVMHGIVGFNDVCNATSYFATTYRIYLYHCLLLVAMVTLARNEIALLCPHWYPVAFTSSTLELILGPRQSARYNIFEQIS